MFIDCYANSDTFPLMWSSILRPVVVLQLRQGGVELPIELPDVKGSDEEFSFFVLLGYLLYHLCTCNRGRFTDKLLIKV